MGILLAFEKAFLMGIMFRLVGASGATTEQVKTFTGMAQTAHTSGNWEAVIQWIIANLPMLLTDLSAILALFGVAATDKPSIKTSVVPSMPVGEKK